MSTCGDAVISSFTTLLAYSWTEHLVDTKLYEASCLRWHASRTYITYKQLSATYLWTHVASADIQTIWRVRFSFQPCTDFSLFFLVDLQHWSNPLKLIMFGGLNFTMFTKSLLVS